MKNKDLILPIIGIIFIASFVHFPQPAVDLTGKEWGTITKAKKKTVCILSDMRALSKEQVPLKKSAKKYVASLDAVLAINPELKEEEIRDILAAIAYKSEPDSHPALDKAYQKATIKKIEIHRWPADEAEAAPHTESLSLMLSPKLRAKFGLPSASK